MNKTADNEKQSFSSQTPLESDKQKYQVGCPKCCVLGRELPKGIKCMWCE